MKRTEATVEVRFNSDLPPELRLSPGFAWMSNGGSNRSHPARSLPYSLDCKLEGLAGAPRRIELLGVFARFAEAKVEPAGTLGATLQIHDEREMVFRQDLVQGRHYGDASDRQPIQRVSGDGTSIATCGEAELDDIVYRVDRLTVDLPDISQARNLVFRDLGSPASFVILGIFIELERKAGCPFHSKSGLIPLREVSAIIRVGDRRRFVKSLEQLEAGIAVANDLDEARGQALTFLAVVTAGMLESGGSRELHRVQLDTARKLDRLDCKEAISKEVIAQCESIAEPLFSGPESPSAHLIDKAMGIVDRNYAKNLSDVIVAQQLGLSTSHFRFLFRETTGSPFHKYLIAIRLEKARLMLLEQGLPVSQVANAVGFTGLSHFSRAFTQRFAASPTSLRRQGA
ncbi:MAG: helix-turn-helix transcriptional regulator [Chlorobia bacterium]|nr:helix-turn-helix transcriptional regulator [Fimbriimonadaceae bacterium]